MTSSIRLLSIAILTSGLVACASEPRQGGPAPVVRAPDRAPAPATVRIPPETLPEPARMPQTPALPTASEPSQPPTETYAYRDPAAVKPPPSATRPPESALPTASPVTEPSQPDRLSVVTGQPDSPVPVSAPQPALQSTQALEPALEPASIPEPEPPKPWEVDAPRLSVETPTPVGTKPASLPSAATAQQPDNLSPAAATLARQADQQRQRGDYAGAAASLERSLRIAPHDAYLWNRLARVRMEQGQVSQAGNLAARSNGYAGGNSSMQRDNWQMIAEARRRAGDVEGAVEAARRSQAD